MQKYVVGVILLLGCSGSAGSSTTETPDAASEVRADEGRIGSGFGSDIGLTGQDADADEPRLDGGAGEEMSEEPGESADGAIPDLGGLEDAGQDAGQDAGRRDIKCKQDSECPACPYNEQWKSESTSCCGGPLADKVKSEGYCGCRVPAFSGCL
jgi:hypothetical protein